MTRTADHKLAVRSAVNDWIGRTFPDHRSLLVGQQPVRDGNSWAVGLVTTHNGTTSPPLGTVFVSDAATIVAEPDLGSVLSLLAAVTEPHPQPARRHVGGDGWALHQADGIAAAAALPALSVDLLLTDPPYGISGRYNCETQIPRRLRPDGTDFTMPRGHFGDWDMAVDPQAWTDAVLPKVRGWAVTFCAQAQIGVYCDLFTEAGFVAVGPMVWHKTNPAPFNHQHKPINAWEALVVGKRSGAAFNGRLVHNVFTHMAPLPRQRIHPTQKPLPLIAEFVELFSQPDGLVFDPFAGAATAVVAARDAGRQVLAYEADPEIFAAAAERLTAPQT